jgi:hypothetical protein
VGVARQLGNFGDTEIGDNGVAVFIDENVRRLDIAMNYATAVRVAERRSYLKQYGTNDRYWQTPRVLNHLFERSAADVPHDEEVDPLSLPDRMHRHDVRVIEIGDGDGFPAEPLRHTLIHQQPRGHDLDGYFAVERDLVGQEDRGHGPATQLLADLELTIGGAS